MITFFIKRFFYAVSVRRAWLLCSLVPTFAYLAFLASHPDRFTVYQDFSISKDTPVALSASPVDFKTMGDVILHPDNFLLDRFAIRVLYMQINSGTTLEATDRLFRPLLETIKDKMSLTVTPQNHIRIIYSGNDRYTGEKLVSFYSQRLSKKIEDGFNRLESINNISKKHADIKTASKSIKLIGNMEVKEHQALIRHDRIFPAIVILILFIMATLTWIGILELTDPSFKSERQVSRYLGIDTLGSLPDFIIISKTISDNRSG